MLHFYTDAPVFVVREITALTRTAWVEDAPSESPAWASSIVHVYEDEAMSVASYLMGVSKIVRGVGQQKPAISDPTFAIAAARIDRDPGRGGAPAYAGRV